MVTLLDDVYRHAEACADAYGSAQTAIPGLTIVRATVSSGLVHAISSPLACLVVQGSKQVTMGTRTFVFFGRGLAADHRGLG